MDVKPVKKKKGRRKREKKKCVAQEGEPEVLRAFKHIVYI